MVNDGGEPDTFSCGILLPGFAFVAAGLNASAAHEHASAHRKAPAGSLVFGKSRGVSKTATAAASWISPSARSTTLLKFSAYLA